MIALNDSWFKKQDRKLAYASCEIAFKEVDHKIITDISIYFYSCTTSPNGQKRFFFRTNFWSIPHYNSSVKLFCIFAAEILT